VTSYLGRCFLCRGPTLSAVAKSRRRIFLSIGCYSLGPLLGNIAFRRKTRRLRFPWECSFPPLRSSTPSWAPQFEPLLFSGIAPVLFLDSLSGEGQCQDRHRCPSYSVSISVFSAHAETSPFLKLGISPFLAEFLPRLCGGDSSLPCSGAGSELPWRGGLGFSFWAVNLPLGIGTQRARVMFF